MTVEVAEEQGALLRKGIGDIFINLARRNQTLLDRQIEFIDQLEANEEDPDQLDNLFKLDHLATRMRRNAESLLVLAGAEPPRRRGRPVALADVVRVAIGEVEDFARISLLALDDVTVGGNVAVDLAHLLSELMENATHFSPPDTTVEIVGHRSETGYTLSVSDQGIGMSADQLAEANNQLARPPLVGLALSRSLGFIVIGRLSSRFGIAVKLTVVVLGWRHRPGHPAGRARHHRRPADGAPPPEPTTAGRLPPAAVDDVVVVDPETDAAVEADGAAGRDLELEEFEQTLAQADFEDEVRSLEAEAEVEVDADRDERDLAVVERRRRRRARSRRALRRARRGDPRRRAFDLPRRGPRGRRLRAGPAVAGQRRARPRPGRRRARVGTHRARRRLSDDDSVPGAFGSTPTLGEARPRRSLDSTPAEMSTAVEEAPTVAASVHDRRSPPSSRPPAWCGARPRSAPADATRRRHADHGHPGHRRQPALAGGSPQDVVPLPLRPQQGPWWSR